MAGHSSEIKKAKTQARQRRFLFNTAVNRTREKNNRDRTRKSEESKLDLQRLKQERDKQIESNRIQWLSRVRSPEIDAQSRDLLDELLWLSENMTALVDFPNHLATVNGIIFDYLPTTLRNLVELPDQNHEVAVESTLRAVTVMAEEVQRIKASIERDRLNRLQSHAEAMKSVFTPTCDSV